MVPDKLPHHGQGLAGEVDTPVFLLACRLVPELVLPPTVVTVVHDSPEAVVPVTGGGGDQLAGPGPGVFQGNSHVAGGLAAEAVEDLAVLLRRKDAFAGAAAYGGALDSGYGIASNELALDGPVERGGESFQEEGDGGVAPCEAAFGHLVAPF